MHERACEVRYAKRQWIASLWKKQSKKGEMCSVLTNKSLSACENGISFLLNALTRSVERRTSCYALAILPSSESIWLEKGVPMNPFVLKRALGIAVLCVSSRGPLDRLLPSRSGLRCHGSCRQRCKQCNTCERGVFGRVPSQ